MWNYSKNVSSILILLLSSLSIKGNDNITDSLRCRTIKLQQQAAWSNPASKTLCIMPYHSTIKIKFLTAPKAFHKIPQLGNGENYIHFSANTFQQISKKDVIWGKAEYKNGKKLNVIWNETSDFLKLFPYVMADDRGGDMKYEQYELYGGYAIKHKKSYIGAELGYHALSEYRDFDPRPNNNSAELKCNIGYGYNLNKNYALMGSFTLGRYKQTNTLIYLNELGAGIEYHITGLNNDFIRFSGTSNNCFFKGNSLGTSIGLVPINGKGFSINLGYNTEWIKKVLTNLNRLPINSLKNKLISSEAVYYGHNKGIKLYFLHNRRIGKDNIFGEPTGNLYKQIGGIKQFSSTYTKLLITGIYKTNIKKKWYIETEPSIGFTALENKHNSSKNMINANSIIFGILFNSNLKTKKGNLYTTFSIQERKCTKHNMYINKLNYNEHIKLKPISYMETIYNYLSNNEQSLNIKIGYDFKILNNKIISMDINFKHNMYSKKFTSNCYWTELYITI